MCLVLMCVLNLCWNILETLKFTNPVQELLNFKVKVRYVCDEDIVHLMRLFVITIFVLVQQQQPFYDPCLGKAG